MPDSEPGKALSTKLNRLSEIARQEPKVRFTSLAHLLDEEFLKESYAELNRYAAVGIDRVSYETYGKNLDDNIANLVERLKSKRYRAQDIRRVRIPKPEGGQRPLGILVLEDKIVQRGVAKILSAIYAQDFLGFTHYLTRSRRAGVRLGRKMIGKRMRRKLIEVNDKLRKLRNALPFRELYKYLCRMLKGYYNYYGFAGNHATLNKFAYAIERMWFKWLNRRSQRKSFNWGEFREVLKRHPLPQPRILKTYRWIYSTHLSFHFKMADTRDSMGFYRKI